MAKYKPRKQHETPEPVNTLTEEPDVPRETLEETDPDGYPLSAYKGDTMQEIHGELHTTPAVAPANTGQKEKSVNILTNIELYRIIVSERQMSHVTKMLNIEKFLAAHPGFTFPPNTPDVYKVQYMESVAHFKIYEASL